MRAPSVIGRLAPSPTGLLHLGHARTFLLAWWHVRRRGGRIQLRMDDLDGPRVREEFVDAARRDLEWLGLDWDGAIQRSSDRLDAMRAAVERLLDSGLAYPCVCSRSEVRLMQSAPHAGEAEPRYPGTCRQRFASLAEARVQSGKHVGVRLMVPPDGVWIDDVFAGRHRFDVQAEVGDFHLARRDGAPAYQLGVVVDDAHAGITEVLRGDDLLPSAARQHWIYRALRLKEPRWIHVPLVTGPDGQRLAKRTNALSIATLRERGVDPREIVQWALRVSGIDDAPRIEANEACELFDLERVPPHAVRYDARFADR